MAIIKVFGGGEGVYVMEELLLAFKEWILAVERRYIAIEL
jgi:hypothetical protein